MFYSISVMVLAFLLDMALGDPHCMPHPVRWIGRLIAGLEPPIRRLLPKSRGGERAGGILLTLLTIAVTLAGVQVVLWGAGRCGQLVRFLAETALCYWLIAARSLRDESMRVHSALQKGDLAGARTAVSMIVGRDTARLTPIQIVKAAVETVAENTSDGVVAPLLFIAIGGAPLGFCYKAINTLDSMIGYRNERYWQFGWLAARLDDLANYIPARLSAGLMIVCAFLCGMDGRGAFRIWRRDRRNHASPNSAQTEAACAGALGIQLAGDACYGGVLCAKPTIGDDLRPAATDDIVRANRLMYLSSVMALVFFCLAKAAVLFVC